MFSTGPCRHVIIERQLLKMVRVESGVDGQSLRQQLGTTEGMV
jgi:hypothetical protein